MRPEQEKQLEEIRAWALDLGAGGECDPCGCHVGDAPFPALLGIVDALRAELASAKEQNEANVKCREASDRANLGLLDELAERTRERDEARK